MTPPEKLSLGFSAEMLFLEPIGIIQDILIFLLS